MVELCLFLFNDVYLISVSFWVQGAVYSQYAKFSCGDVMNQSCTRNGITTWRRASISDVNK